MPKYLLTAIFILIRIFSFSQEIPKTVNKTYQAEDGKFYIQKSMPVYLYLSNSPDSNATKHRLRSKKTSAYTNPMYFDTDGFNSVRTNWAVKQKTKQKVSPQKEIVFEVYADSKAPETYGLFDKKTIGYKDKMRIYPIGTKLSLLEYDAVVGTSKIYYSVNEKAYTEYTNAIEFNTAEIIKIKFYGLDYVGNQEEIHKLNFIIE